MRALNLLAAFPGKCSSAAVDQDEFNRCCIAFGVEPDVTLEELERVYLKKSYALIRAGTPDEREQLRALHEKLAAHLKAHPPATRLGEAEAPPVAASGPVYQPPSPDPRQDLLNPLSFDSWLVNLLAMPVVMALAWLVNRSPLGFFLQGFHIWMHEFGHATVAWFTGKRALPLPIGWTNVGPEKSNFVYFGVLLLLVILLVAGWKERKVWPMLLAVALAPLQYYMTWRLPEHRADLWLAFGGVGGEFYLSTALMALFYVQFPEKFKWGCCRYVLLFLGASSFLNILLFWREVRRGNESIPWGSMVSGEEDAGGDMNILRDDYHWSNHDIIGTYNRLGSACLVALAVVYLVFALRLDRVADRVVGRGIKALWPE